MGIFGKQKPKDVKPRRATVGGPFRMVGKTREPFFFFSCPSSLPKDPPKATMNEVSTHEPRLHDPTRGAV